MVTNLSETTTSICERINIQPLNAVLLVKNSRNIQAVDIQFIEQMAVGFFKMEITGQSMWVVKNVVQEMVLWLISDPQRANWLKIHLVPGLKASQLKLNVHKRISLLIDYLKPRKNMVPFSIKTHIERLKK